ncbi:MAG TPA: transcription factor S [Candidatus Aenigmarchaeota archaeon]|nr:transcription factor S [Candidatus Aenigmarchaeota archaeon]
MEFCPKCGNVLSVIRKKGKIRLYCKRCNKYYKPKQKVELSERIREKKREIVIMGKDEGLKELPVTQIICPRCGNDKAYWWMQQTRSADEPPTLFYRCTKCGYSWRSYA